MEVLIWSCCFAAGWVIGQAVQRFMIVRSVLKGLSPDARKRLLSGTPSAPEEVPMLYTETADGTGTIFAYDSITHQFMCSGADIPSLAFNVNEHCNITVAHVKHSDKVLTFVNGELYED